MLLDANQQCFISQDEYIYSKTIGNLSKFLQALNLISFIF